MNARVFIGGVEVYMAVCLRCLCGGMMEKQLGQHVKAGIACEDAGISKGTHGIEGFGACVGCFVCWGSMCLHVDVVCVKCV